MKDKCPYLQQYSAAYPKQFDLWCLRSEAPRIVVTDPPRGVDVESPVWCPLKKTICCKDFQ